MSSETDPYGTRRMRLVRFLLVEDDDAHARLIERCLTENRVRNELVRLKDGGEAFDFVDAKGPYEDREVPDVVLLDLRLPKRDGHEVLEHMRASRLFRNVPVVVLTTSNAEVDREKAYEHQANSYLVKPVDFDQLNLLVRDLSLYWGVWNESPPSTP